MILRFVGFEAFLIVRVVLWLNHVKPGPRKKKRSTEKKGPGFRVKNLHEHIFLDATHQYLKLANCKG